MSPLRRPFYRQPDRWLSLRDGPTAPSGISGGFLGRQKGSGGRMRSPIGEEMASLAPIGGRMWGHATRSKHLGVAHRLDATVVNGRAAP
jgi:hypothetical protein